VKSALCYFSGAGNSKAVAHDLGSMLPLDSILPIADVMKDPSLLEGTDTLGLVFPIYFYGPPALMKRFILETLHALDLKIDYLFVILTHGGMPFYAASITDRLLAEAGYAASYVSPIAMVDTYVPLFRIPDSKKQTLKHTKIAKRIEKIGKELLEQQLKVATRLPLSRLMHTMWDRSLELRGEKDRHFVITDACTGCALCARTCPVKNIAMEGGKPTFLHACEQCFGCYHRCPEHAIALDPKPLRGYGWYTPPKSFKA